ncbi:RFX DNA-binding domain-containing protein [Xylaria bambusicola]|uniref:RFX DNA-binding domain-containing protein n=1 Tax=Xylaria bambusicola TaxID=326684 RepID=UPI002007A4C7|nr:RFX DNA-binding domain-containing protein [Xylaria bambusicola]KAI0514364.1 RFX DNA-binding domain-containing protein [Xylaria bambusicola]
MSQQDQRKRTQSRGSTASMHSITTQPNHERSLSAVHQGGFQDQWSVNGHTVMPHSKDMSAMGHQMGQQMNQQMTGDDMMRSATPIPLQQHFTMNTGMHHQPVGAAAPYAHHPAAANGLSIDSYGTGTSFTDADSQMIMDRDDPDESDRMEVVRPAGQKSTSGRASANNELEMRALYQASRHRKLEDVAKELHGNERGPNSERARQVFAMLWLNQVCAKGKGSVPRGRVYANYASRCATERITVLNPASFGKLVRVLFPGLKTRRLGVRGESKYHYVNFTLMEDQPELKEPVVQPALPIQEASQPRQSFNTAESQTTVVNALKPALPSPQINNPPEKHPSSLATSVTMCHSLYNQADVASIDQLRSAAAKTMLHLAFPRDGDDQFDSSQPLILPKIQPFLPSGTDSDAAKSLAALYRSHCTSLVECIRYCKEKTFFHLYTSFQGTLTMPVQKLFANPSLAPWIEQCDFTLYQRMTRIIAGLTLQVVPKPVLDTLRNISERLVIHIRDAFQGQPRHVVRAKEAPATIFSAILDRALRVNLTAHAAANMLANPSNRNSMYLDWISMVRIRKIAECVPTRGMDDLVQVLISEMRGLLDPTNVPWDLECLTLYGDLAQQQGQNSESGASNGDNPQNMLDRWVQFLSSLPNRFPYATPADIVWCVQRVGTEVMRDLTIAQGKSFGSWWVTKCWIDEMVAFLAEQGGFMQTVSSTPAIDNAKRSTSVPVDTVNANLEERGRQSESVELNASPSLAAQAQPDRAPFPSRVDGPDPDDSGIGIRTPEEDFPIEKFSF